MAQILSLKTDRDKCDTLLTKTFQSGHINFLLGSGASFPAIDTAGSIESDLNALLESNQQDEFDAQKLAFLCAIQKSTNDLIEGNGEDDIAETLTEYASFLNNAGRILSERKTEILPKQATIFTTNYDLFIERACEEMRGLRLNDGFVRNPAVQENYSFQPECFFEITFKTGTLFKYRFPIPTINLVKLHGSVSWQLSNEELSYCNQTRPIPDELSDTYSEDVSDFEQSFSLILPTRQKFHETFLTRVYYDLLRIFANTLEIENTALICFGFSFNDEHIRDIVTRALKNPTLLVIIFSYDGASAEDYKDKFDNYNNVVVIHSDDETINFSVLNSILLTAPPRL